MKRHPFRISTAVGFLLLGLTAFFLHRQGVAPAPAVPALMASALATPVQPEPAAQPPPRRRQSAGAPATPAPEVSPVFVQFDDWTRRYLTASAAGRGSLMAEGRELAAARRTELSKLIRTDPRLALAAAVPMVVRQQLPADIVALLEDRVSGRGELALNGVTPLPGQAAREASFRSALVNGQEYRAHVFGRRDLPGTVGKTSMNGIALDGHFAVAESPVRVLEPGELAAGRPLNEVCDVSGTATPTAADTPLNAGGAPTAIEYDGTVHILCGANHLAAAESRLLAREQSHMQNGAAGGPGSSGVAGRPDAAWTHGPKRLLAIRVDFPDVPGAPRDPSGNLITEDYAANVTRTVQDFYADNSFGKTTLVAGPAVNGDSPDVTPVLRMPQPATYYDGRLDGIDRSGLLHQDARNAAALAGFNVTGYDRVGVVFSGLNYWWAGLGNIIGKNFWINAYWDLRVVAHEIGHNYGMMHSNYWQPPEPYTDAISLAGTSLEYVDYMDVMGSGGEPKHHFSHWNKSIMQWIPDSSVTTVERSGTYRVHRLDDGAANLSLPRALKLRFDDVRDYWISFRGAMTEYNAAHGAYTLWGYHTNQQGNLLNLGAPGSTWTYDAPLPVGASFTDTVNGITMRTLAEGGSGADRWLDIQFVFPSSVRWSQTTEYIAGEQESVARVRVMRYGDTGSAITVNYATSGGAAWDGRATAGQDYVETTGTLTWAAGETADKFITVPVISDTIWEGGERFKVRLSMAGAGMITGNAEVDVAILDPGIRDFSFNADPVHDRVFAAVVQPDGNILIGGPFQQAYDQHFQPHDRRGLAQLSADGRLMPGFTTGVSGGEGIVRDLALHTNGRVLVAGSFQFVGDASHANIARLNADGSVDATFTASANGQVWSVLVQPDGRILLGGAFTSVNGVPREYVARLNADGSLDTTFTGPNFEGNQQVNALALQPDGRIVAGGSFMLPNGTHPRIGVCRLMPNGALDPAFVVREGAGNVKALAIQPDGRVLIGGDFTSYDAVPRGRIARLQANGSLDTSFTASIDDGRCNALLALPDGRVLAGGWFFAANGTPTRGLLLMSSTGTLDPHVVENGGFPGELYDFELLANGRIQFAGTWSTFQSNDARTIWRMISGLGASPGSVQFATSAVTGTEGTHVTLSVSRSGGSVGAISVGYSATPGTASAADYGAASGSVTWADGDAAAKTITIPLTDDGAEEAAETFTVALATPTGGAALGSPAQATITIQANGGPPPPPPGNWQAGDVGPVGATGSSSESGGTVTVSGSGADIWGPADAFQFRHQQLTGDGAIIVRVATVGNTHPWAKVGIMFREDLTPGSREVMAFITPGNHSGLQYRLEPGAQSGMGADLWSGIPVWLMLVRSGDTFGGYRSYDGVNWTPLGTINCNLPDTAYVGFAVSSHAAGFLLTATFDNVEVTGVEPPPEDDPPNAPTDLSAGNASGSTIGMSWTDNSADETGFVIERAPGFTQGFTPIGSVPADTRTFRDTGLAVNSAYSYRVRAQRGTVYSEYSNTITATTNDDPPPSDWFSADIGTVGLAGSESMADANITVRAGGADIWGTADGFRFVYQAWTGDGEIRARVAGLDNTHVWAKAGVMFRETLDAGSRNVAYLLTAANTSGLQARAATGGETSFINGPWVNAPYWVRLVRAGNTFTASTSPDGMTWTERGSQTVAMGAAIYVGLATSAHTTTALTTALFESVQLPEGEPPPPPPPPPTSWTQTALGNASGSFSTPAENAVTVSSTGDDIWNSADSALFLHRTWDADGAVIVRVDSLTNTHPWAKAGIMMRENLTNGSRNVFLGLTATSGATFQIRGTTGGQTTEVSHSWQPGAPCWFRLTRAGETIQAHWSTNGTTWNNIGSIGISQENHNYVGLAVSSHAATATTAVFTNIQLGDAPPPPPPPPPPPGSWTRTTLGNGSGAFTTPDATRVTINAVGADLWGQFDDGMFVQQAWNGDGEIVARVDSLTNTHPWAKAGLMFRANLTATSPNVFVGLTPTNGATFQVRAISSGVTTEPQHSWLPGVPYWLRLRRTGDTFTSSFSTDGVNWTTFGSQSVAMPASIFVGFGVSSHTTGSTAAAFSNVQVR